MPPKAFFEPPSFKEGNQFTRKDSPLFLECSASQDFQEHARFNRSFRVYLKDSAKGVKEPIGKIATAYFPKEQKVDVGILEIDPRFQGKGYGKESLRTVLGIYRSPKNSSLAYNHFFLTVSIDNNAAIALYRGVGFQVDENLTSKGIPWLYMTLSRDVE